MVSYNFARACINNVKFIMCVAYRDLTCISDLNLSQFILIDSHFIIEERYNS